MVETELKGKEVPYRKTIITLSIVVPLVVALLFGMPKIDGYDTSFLPPVYAMINAVTALLLVTAVVAVRNGRRRLHERIMKACISLSALFLALYVIYHITNESTSFGGDGPIRYVYFFVLVTHILLSIGVIPLVLLTFVRALTGDFTRHRRLARITFPIWLYVAISGVIVYLMISPYYK